MPMRRLPSVTRRRPTATTLPRQSAATRIVEDAHSRSRADRARSAAERERTREARNLTTIEREGTAVERDAAATLRDAVAEARDQTADARDIAAEAHERALGKGDGIAAAIRDSAAADRWRAAADRQRAAQDRAQAAHDRKRALAELEDARISTTSPASCAAGWARLALENEMARARRTDGRLVLAFIDVDGLKAVNDSHGRAAGDAVLQELASVLRQNLRPYEPVVRIGGDEFVCAMIGTDLETATRRFTEIKQIFDGSSIASMSFGLAVLDERRHARRPDGARRRIAARGPGEALAKAGERARAVRASAPCGPRASPGSARARWGA